MRHATPCRPITARPGRTEPARATKAVKPRRRMARLLRHASDGRTLTLCERKAINDRRRVHTPRLWVQPDVLLGGGTPASAKCRPWSGRAVRRSSCAILLSVGQAGQAGNNAPASPPAAFRAARGNHGWRAVESYKEAVIPPTKRHHTASLTPEDRRAPNRSMPNEK